MPYHSTSEDRKATETLAISELSNEPPSGTYAIRAVDRVCDILDVLANADGGATLPEVAAATGVPKSTTFRYLSALEVRRYVERDPEGTSFQLGIAFRPQRTHAIERLTEVSQGPLERLRDDLSETVNLGVLDGVSIVHTAVYESPHMMRLAARVGDRGYLHSTALGKTICSALTPHRVTEMLKSQGMPQLTEKTITTTDAFLQELQEVAEAGYGLDNEENQLFGRCIATRIPDIGIPAGISVSAPLSRFPEHAIPEIAGKLQACAAEIAAHMSAEGLPSFVD